MEVSFSKDLSGRHKAFKIRGHIRRKGEWLLVEVRLSRRAQVSSLKGLCSHLWYQGAQGPEVTPPFRQSTLDLPPLGSERGGSVLRRAGPPTCLSFSDASCLSPPREIICVHVMELWFPFGL